LRKSQNGTGLFCLVYRALPAHERWHKCSGIPSIYNIYSEVYIQYIWLYSNIYPKHAIFQIEYYCYPILLLSYSCFVYWILVLNKDDNILAVLAVTFETRLICLILMCLVCIYVLFPSQLIFYLKNCAFRIYVRK